MKSRLTSMQINQLHDLITKMERMNVFSEFIKPISNTTQFGRQYREVIKNPLSISQIKTKLSNSKYTSISDIKADFDLMWDNGKRFNQTGLYYIISEVGELFTNKKLKKITMQSTSDWLVKCQELTKELKIAVNELNDKIAERQKEKSSHESKKDRQ
jgi:hypothetical protein